MNFLQPAGTVKSCLFKVLQPLCLIKERKQKIIISFIPLTTLADCLLNNWKTTLVNLSVNHIFLVIARFYIVKQGGMYTVEPR